MNLLETVKKRPLLAILRGVPLEKTVSYAEAVLAGGVDFFEVALNSPCAREQISLLCNHFGDSVLVGAGTAVSVELAKTALDAGARFLLTPGTPLPVFEYCQKNGVPLLPGVLTPSDVATSLQYGYSVMKLFPAGEMPTGYIKSLKGPFDKTEYVAIGGVTAGNIKSFFEAGYIGVGLGSSLMPKSAVEQNDWETGSTYVKSLLDKIKA